LLAPISQHDLTKPGSEQEVNNFSLNLDYLVGEYTLTGLFGYSDYDYSLSTDLDGVAFAGAGIPGLSLDAMSYEEYEQYSGEIRLTSPGGETFDYVVGIYYQDSTLTSDQPNIQQLPPGFVLPDSNFLERGNNVFEQDATLWSGFVSVTWNMTDAFRLIGGGRYSDDDKDWTRSSICQHSFDEGANWVPASFNTGACALASDQGGNIGSDNFMPEIVAQYDWGDDTMVFAKYSESAKSGGAATGTSVPDGEIVYDDETAKGFEVGLKTSFADGMAEFNAVAFYTEFDDLQVKSSTFAGTRVVTTIGNAGQATTQGIELDGRWAATDWLTLGGAVAYLDASYDDYKGGPCNTSGSTPASITGKGCDLDDEDLPFSPEWSGSVFADVVFPLTGGLNLVGNVTASYSDEYLSDGTLEPELMQDSYTKYDASIGLAAEDNRWNVSVIGKNLSDEEINMSGQSLGAGYDIAYLMPPRMVVLQATWRFGNF
jgi:outer membrane receptor protein involved in Fe transport